MYKILILAILLLAGCTSMNETKKMEIDRNELAVATFAGGCFWCMEAAFEGNDGVIDVISGYSGGKEENPTYQEVGSGQTGHLEAIQVYYNPLQTTFKDLVDWFFRNIDPTDDSGQFADKGSQYRTAIFYKNNEEKKVAELAKEELTKSGIFDKPIMTKILSYKNFYTAEEYHQDYYKKNPLSYNRYAKGSGRKDFIEETWKDEQEEKPKTCSFSTENLTDIQREITQNNGTEKAFDNEYWDEKRDGIYVDVVSGEVLFSSTDKFDSGTGWPSFTKPINNSKIIKKTDNSFGIQRTEVRSKDANSHLGHWFDDGPEESRFCINSAALRFIPKEDMKKEGYEEYLYIFENNS